jgi:hypothetical protein
VRVRHERGLVDLEELQHGLEIVERGLAHADDADVFGFDQRDACVRQAILGQHALDDARAHPAGGSAAQHDHVLDRLVHAASGASQSHPVIA